MAPRPPDDRRGDDLGLVVAVPFRQEIGELLVPVSGQLEDDQPLLGPLDAVLPPVGARDRPGDLPARGEPGRYPVVSEFHRLGPRVSCRLHLEVTHLGAGRPALTTDSRAEAME